MSTSVFWVFFLLSAAPLWRTQHEDICLRQFRIFTSSFELTRNVLVPELSISGSPLTCGLGWQKSKICIVNNKASLAEPSALFTGSWIVNDCERVISIDLHQGTPQPAFLRRSGAKRQRCPCIYYFNTTTAFCPLSLGDLVFKLNPGPAHTSSRQCSRSTRNTENLITPDRIRLYPSDQQLTLCTLNARSLNNKSAAFLDLVCNVKADLFTICETWLRDHHSAVLSELTPPGYRTLIHCPRPCHRPRHCIVSQRGDQCQQCSFWWENVVWGFWVAGQFWSYSCAHCYCI